MENIVYGLILLAVAALIAYVVKRQRRREREDSVTGALGTTFEQLRTNPQRLNTLRGKVAKVGVITQEIDHGRQGGFRTRRESFYITVDGEVTELESAEDDISVEENARWLARQLRVPFECD